MFEDYTLRGDASDGDTAPKITGSNTPCGHRSRGRPSWTSQVSPSSPSSGRWGGRGSRGCMHRDGHQSAVHVASDTSGRRG